MSQIDCNEVLSEIEQYLDGELHDGQYAEVKEHLSRCGPCMDRSEFRKQLRELLCRSCACEEVPAQLLERVEALLGEPGDLPA